MSESDFLGNTPPKISFLFGFFVGVTVTAIVGVLFFTLNSSSAGSGNGVAATPTGGTGTPAPAAAQPSQPTAAAAIPAVTDADHMRGDKNAKITLVEYSDFQCPFCLKHVDTLTKILAEYPGKVRLVYRHFPLTNIHPQAQKAAEASECASEQGKFWEMHDAIFQAQATNTMGIDQWKTVAKDLGLNTSQFNDCLDTGKYASAVATESQQGQAAGATGTPATFVNGQLVSGAVPYENFKSILDSLL
ncbi:DsbA family protein [Candidatus Falkowbacteria bacterium]|nr:DsbA family protein [Candidatus Falkowbacteria bacterium]